MHGVILHVKGHAVAAAKIASLEGGSQIQLHRAFWIISLTLYNGIVSGNSVKIPTDI